MLKGLLRSIKNSIRLTGLQLADWLYDLCKDRE